MKIALAQINSYLGDFAGNRSKIFKFVVQAKDLGADLVVFPEAALFGYHPCDLLERPSVVNEQLKELARLHRQIPKGIAILVGAFVRNTKPGKPYLNVAAWLENGKRAKFFAKELLPTYDVFDEGRHIEPGDLKRNQIRFKGKKILITICEDIWAWPRKSMAGYSQYRRNPLLNVPDRSVDLVINLSASPFADSKWKARQEVTGATARRFKCPLVYVNMIGAQDELIFDGGSFVKSFDGKILQQCRRFEEDLKILDLNAKPRGAAPLREDRVEIRERALILGLRDFVRKTGFKKVHLGLSGGVDSAVVACLAVEALGPENVIGFALPGPYSAPESLKWAKELAGNLGIELFELSIVEAYTRALKDLERSLGQLEFGVLQENLQARLRALMLMAYANKEQSLLMATSNKSELATGYSTLYGDMCGGLMPIGDLLKNEVYELARYFNREQEVIPDGILTRPPSAELRPNQRDQDTLPPYSELDPAVEILVEGQDKPVKPIEKRVLEMLMKSEFKRWQAAPILKVSDHAFGRGRRLPLAHKALF